MPTTDFPKPLSDATPERDARSKAVAAIDELRQKGGIFVEAVRATRMPMALTDPNLHGNPIVFANQAFLKLSGYGMDEVLGQQPHFMNGPDTDPRDAARFAEALRGDQDDVIETVQYRKNGSSFVATVLLSAFKDEDGHTLNHFMSWLDVTRRVAAEDEVSALRKTQELLRASEAKYRGLFDSIDEGFCVIEVLFDDDGQAIDYVFLETNASFERQTGISDAAGKRMRGIAPTHEQHWFDIYGRIALSGEAERFEQPAHAFGRWYDVYAFRVGDPAQKRVAILFNDIAERKRAEKALRESERLRTAMLDVLPLGLALIDRHGNAIFTNAEWSRFIPGNRIPSSDEARGRRWKSWDENGRPIDPSDFPGARALRGEHVYPPMEFLFTDDEGREIWTSVGAIPLLDNEGEIAGAVCVIANIDDAKRAKEALQDSERHAQALLAELQHRVRNILAMIQSVVRRTQDTSDSAEEYVRHLGGRIAAIARTQILLTRTENARVDLEEVLRDELLRVAASDDQFWCEGPQVALPAKAAEILTLAIHELATNSVKYGALSHERGQIEISWDTEDRDGQEWLRFEWNEARGSAVDLEREGFGTELITRRVPYELCGKGWLESTGDGVMAAIEFPVAAHNGTLETRPPGG